MLCKLFFFIKKYLVVTHTLKIAGAEMEMLLTSAVVILIGFVIDSSSRLVAMVMDLLHAYYTPILKKDS